MASTPPISVPVRVTAQLPMAWRHHCGTLNDSAWPSRERESVCSGCRCEVRLSEVEARYLLVDAVRGES